MKQRITFQLTYNEAVALREAAKLAANTFQKHAAIESNQYKQLVQFHLTELWKELVLRTVFESDVSVAIRFTTGFALRIAVEKGFVIEQSAHTTATAIYHKFYDVKKPAKKKSKPKRLTRRKF
jgi:hypothetical protein